MVTILMAVYNGEEYLKDQLDSIRWQTYDEWELIIRDDGSTDGSKEILTQFQDSVSQRVEIVTNQPPSGSAKANFAKLLEDAWQRKASYIMCCDQDDIWKPEKIEVTLEKMLESENGNHAVPILVHTDLQVVDVKGRVIAESMFALSQLPKQVHLASLLVQNNVTGCTMMMNQSLLEGIHRLAASDFVIMHDYLAAIYAEAFGRLVLLDRTTISYRQHGGNSVGAKASSSPRYLLKRFKEGRKEYQKAMQESRKQAAGILDAYQSVLVSDRDKMDILNRYQNLGDKSKWGRRRFYLQNHAWKTGIVRKVMQWLWG